MEDEKGFTLIEVLASLVIISIVLMSFMSIFANTNALAVSNSEKLVVINLADAFLERVKVDPVGTIHTEATKPNKTLTEYINLNSCPLAGTIKVCPEIKLQNQNTSLNNREYEVRVQFSQTQSSTASGIYSEKDLKLVNVLVTVTSPTSNNSSSVEGYVTDEKNN